MTIAKETTRSGPYAGDDLNKTFSYHFRIDDKSHIDVVKIQVDGSESLLALDGEYQVTGVGNRAGGTVVLTQALASGESLVILRDQPLRQEMDLENQGPFFAEEVERAFDHSVMRDQELAERLGRAVTVAVGDNTDPRDYLAQMQALLNQALASIEGNAEISVLTHGAKGDRVTNDLAAFQAARDRAIALGLDRVVVPVPPDPDNWYFLLGDIEGVADVEWIMDPRAAVNGSTNLFAVQQKWSGATVWEGPTEEATVLPINLEKYSHQAQVGVDLDGEWIVTYQTNDTSPREGRDQQIVALHKSTDSGQGLTWSDRIDFATSATHCTNPIPMDGEPEGQRFTLWRTGVINFQQEGFGSKLWVRYGHGRATTQANFTVAQKTSAAGKYTLYQFYMLADGTIKPIRYGDAIPEGASFKAWSHEGRPNLYAYCHDTFFGSNGRLHFLMIMLENGEPFRQTPHYALIMYCDNPGADIDEMVFKLGPSINFGDMNPATLWECSMAEQEPGFYVMMMRANESLGSGTLNEGQRHYVAFGDGVNFTGFKPAGLHAHRDRPSLIRLNNELMAYITFDEPTTRANPAIWIKNRGGGFAPGLSVGDVTPVTVNRARSTKASANDTLLQAIDTRTETVIGFTEARVGVQHFSSAGQRVDMALEGYIPDWPASTLDMSHVDYTAGDKAVVEVSGLEETFFVDGGANTSFIVEGDLTAANPDVLAYGAGQESTLSIGPGGAVVATASDGLEIQASATDIDFVVLHQTGSKGTITFATGQSVIDVSASLGFGLTEDWTDVTLLEGAEEDTVEVPELDGILSTVNSNLQVLKDTSASDSFRWGVRRGNQVHVPTANRHPDTGDLLVAGAPHPITSKDRGGKGLQASLLRAESFPRTDQLVFIPRKSAQVEDGLAGHDWSWGTSTGLLRMSGKTSAGASLKPGRWQISGRARLTGIPVANDNARILQIGNFEEIVSLEASWRTPHLLRDLHQILRSGGSRDTARERPMARDILTEVQLESGVYVLRDDAWFGWTFQYDSYRGEVTIEGETIPLQWPFVLTFGDGYLLSDAPTDRSLYLDVGSVKVQELPADHRQWNRIRARPHAPNLIPNPGMAVEREKDGESGFPVQQPRAFLPGWSIQSRGGCTVTSQQGQNSQEAANREFGGWPHFLNLSVDGAVRSPETAATEEVVFDFAWPGIGAVPSGNYMLQMDMEDGSDPGEQNTARGDGLGILLYWFQAYGERARKGRKRYQVHHMRVPRWQKSFALPIPVPQIELKNAGVVVQPDSYCGFEFHISAGYNCKLRIRNIDFFRGDEPREWMPPSPYLPDETRRIWYEVKGAALNQPVVHGTLRNASEAEFVFDLPDMARPPYLEHEGRWAFDHAGVYHTGAPTLEAATDEHAVVVMRKTGAALTAGDPVSLKGVSKPTIEMSPNGSRTLFSLDGPYGDKLFSDMDVDSVIHTSSGGAVATLTMNEKAILRPSYEAQRDRLIGAGQAAWTPEVSLPNTASAINMVKMSEASGEESLVVGSGGFTLDQSAVDGVGTARPVLAGGTASTFVAGSTYDIDLKERETVADLWTDTVYPASGTLEMLVGGGRTDAELAFDARPNRPIYRFQEETEAIWSGITTKPSAKEAGRPFLKFEIDRTVVDLKAAGIWDELDLLYCFASHDEQSALLNWMNPGSNSGTATNAPVFTAWRGYEFDGSTNFILIDSYTLSSAPTNFLQNSASLSSFVVSHTQGPVAGSSFGFVRLNPNDGVDSEVSINGSAQNAKPYIRSDGLVEGYQAIDRGSSAGFTYYGQGRKAMLRGLSVTETSAAVPSAVLRFGRGGPDYAACEMAWGSLGGHLSEAQHKRLAWIMEDHLIRIGAL